VLDGARARPLCQWLASGAALGVAAVTAAFDRRPDVPSLEATTTLFAPRLPLHADLPPAYRRSISAEIEHWRGLFLPTNMLAAFSWPNAYRSGRPTLAAHFTAQLALLTDMKRVEGPAKMH
jgi:hypothetical protein